MVRSTAPKTMSTRGVPVCRYEITRLKADVSSRAIGSGRWPLRFPLILGLAGLNPIPDGKRADDEGANEAGPDEEGPDDEGPELSPDEVEIGTILGVCRSVGNAEVGVGVFITGMGCEFVLTVQIRRAI